MNIEAYEAIIGLEVHTHLLTLSKLFCGCSTRFGAGPNANVCPRCMGMPGVLPVLNRRVVELAIRTGLATHCTIAPYSIFDRKSYFYPDLPKGYQITQYETPICKGGYIDLPSDGDGQPRRIRLTRIHIEEDAGKNIHAAGASLIDFNRSGVPLIEIVSEPDLRSSADAGAYLRQLRAILRYVDASDGKMEEGSFRCDCNVSVRKRGATEFGTRTEIKNLNSFRFVENAIDHEVARQIEILEAGGRVPQETLLWDPARNETRLMRSKEYANDYRYFPEPDLPPLIVEDAMVEQIRATMPELPADRRARYVRELSLTDYEAGVLTSDRDVADYFEATLPGLKNRKAAANWVMTEVLRVVRESGKSINDAAPLAAEIGALLRMVEDQKISFNAAKTAFAAMVKSGKSADTTVAELGLAQVSDESAIAAACEKIIAAEPAKLAEYRAGRDKLFGFFVGQVMKAMGGKANPKVINDILKQKLAG
ncbi:MAG: Asp-tRNA(Asn)/Glu-tRNA(Gln) amidotransferase subunit GatB [Candidatus Binatus sp.]|uniref:Asp-tRNA(Asn)/Glu-tRNA(Gln) amidotransferase subunit GatB n=1 Tax=Candidatus Binatus sp. TaxID=2811406 RepID=UPI00271A9CF2|nr:Asp-tRNA(Asn)/Glu-tRNA(Gln) amidotransferase subunit GatB [Candidatus Binatus sp.]MDO8433457.1 Asp-tRNA(Asn)/Glu-tRNA(Gln) amidotransferase subunit GatB [Candidatus Binatus sp.]